MLICGPGVILIILNASKKEFEFNNYTSIINTKGAPIIIYKYVIQIILSYVNTINVYK